MNDGDELIQKDQLHIEMAAILDGSGDGNNTITHSNSSPNTKQHDDNTHDAHESCELLMHIIHQNIKVQRRMYKKLKVHEPTCDAVLNSKEKEDKKLSNSPPQTPTSHKSEGFDFNTIKRQSMTHKKDKDKDREKCSKQCTVEKFKYIVEKYIRSTQINLSWNTSSHLKYIYGELRKTHHERFKPQEPRSQRKKPFILKTGTSSSSSNKPASFWANQAG